jgi:hypothetical protein
MPELPTLFLAACMFAGAALYTSVGHAGASALLIGIQARAEPMRG